MHYDMFLIDTQQLIGILKKLICKLKIIIPFLFKFKIYDELYNKYNI